MTQGRKSGSQRYIEPQCVLRSLATKFNRCNKLTPKGLQSGRPPA